MTLGTPDANGVGRYVETTPIGTKWSDYMNLGLATVSAALTALLSRRRITERGRESFPASASAVMKTRDITFATPFPSAPAAVVVSGWVNSSSGTVYGATAENITAAGFRMRVATASGAAWTGAAGPFDWEAIL